VKPIYLKRTIAKILQIICACLPVLRPLVARIFPRGFSSSAASKVSRISKRVSRRQPGAHAKNGFRLQGLQSSAVASSKPLDVEQGIRIEQEFEVVVTQEDRQSADHSERNLVSAGSGLVFSIEEPRKDWSDTETPLGRRSRQSSIPGVVL
jgi:hypothetical protein